MLYQTEVLIVGAGISGLMAATHLSQAGYQVLIVDKGRGVGGRMATRRIGAGRADHGAQFFTARSALFKQHVETWLEQQLIFEWASGWSKNPDQNAKKDGFPRYAGQGGMTAVPKALAASQEVHLNCKLVKVAVRNNQWYAIDDKKNEFLAPSLLLTSPVPQSLALLQAGAVSLTLSDQAALEGITYAPCVAGIFEIEGDINLPEPGAIQRPTHRYRWIANNQQKGISPAVQLITIHANPDLSRQIWEQPKEAQIEVLTVGIRPFLAQTAAVKTAQAHRWRYAQPITLHPDRTLVASGVPFLAFAGDGFKEARVEGAALSGVAAAQALLKKAL